MNDALQWTIDNQIGLGKQLHTRRKMALYAILARLPSDFHKIAPVPLDGGGAALSVVVATDKTTDDLARAENMELIQRVQSDMNMNQPQDGTSL